MNGATQMERTGGGMQFASEGSLKSCNIVIAEIKRKAGGAVKIKSFMLFLILSLVMSGCDSETTGTIKIDLLNYLDDAQKTMSYDFPAVSGSGAQTSDPDSIDFSGDVVDVNEIQSVEMIIHIEFQNDSGTVDLNYAAYLASLDEEALSTTAIVSEDMSLDGDMLETTEITVTGDARLIELFNTGIMQYQTQLSYVVPDGSGNIKGVAEVVRFDVTIVTTL